MTLLPSVQLHPSRDLLRLLPLLREAGKAVASVRKDFFDYLPRPRYEDGIRMRDTLMLRLIVAEAAAR
jgi:hypothetical protein